MKTDYVVKACRQNGMFAYRPDFETKKLYSVDEAEEEWAKEYPLGEGGKIGENWLTDRHKWLDEVRSSKSSSKV